MTELTEPLDSLLLDSLLLDSPLLLLCDEPEPLASDDSPEELDVVVVASCSADAFSAATFSAADLFAAAFFAAAVFAVAFFAAAVADALLDDALLDEVLAAAPVLEVLLFFAAAESAGSCPEAICT